MKPAGVGIFFDRDGTINTEVDFLTRPEDLHLIPKAAAAIREANELGVKTFLITNQSGIARGLMTERDLARVHRKLKEMLAAQDAHIDGIYYCPHHPDYGTSKYRKQCQCRKPKTGMLRQAAREHRIDLAASFVVGDRCVDMMAGNAAGCSSLLVLTGYGRTEQRDCSPRTRIDHVARDAYAAWKYIRHILRQRKRRHSTKKGKLV